MSRTSKSITNGKFAFVYYFTNLILGFISRKAFIEYIGIEVLGLNQTAQNLLGFLNLAELGIGSAIAFTLYKPLANDDHQSIIEIVTVQGWLYRRIAFVIALGAFILMVFFPIIFKNTGLPLWYAYTSFGVFLYSSLLTYFVNYKQILFSASQQEYKITKHYNFVMLLKSTLQIVAIIYLPFAYIWWLILQVVFASLASWNLNRAIKKTFPYLQIELSKGKALLKKYANIITKVKQLFFHAIGGFVLTQTSSLIIFAFVDLTMVAIYGNYILISNCVRMLFNAIFTGVTAGIGNLVAEGDNKKIISVFEELFSSKFLIITSFLLCFYEFANPFMTIWVGKDYLLDKPVLLVIVLTLYILLSRTTVDSYIYATGLFQDIWAPVTEAILNVGLSILLGYYFGVIGVLLGVLVSLIVVILVWKPYFLFKKGLKLPIGIYIWINLKHFIAFAIAAVITLMIFGTLSLPTPSDYFSWGGQAVTFTLIFFFVLTSILYLISAGMRNFFRRVNFQLRKL